MRTEVARKFPLFGPNKIQAIIRLVYEISLRDKKAFTEVLEEIPQDLEEFFSIKKFLERIRYPEAYAQGLLIQESYTSVEIDPSAACDLARSAQINPKVIFIERAAEVSLLVDRIRRLYPQAEVLLIDQYCQVVLKERAGAIEYNHRFDQWFIVHEKFDFFKRCPCTPGVKSCGYHNVNLGFGCPFECSYCFLQNYSNAPGIVFPSNIEDFFDVFKNSYQDRRLRLGSGETTDSLAFDHITQFAPKIVDFFRFYPETIFEFKTKSDRIEGLLSVSSSSNIVAAWSVNPQGVIDREEFLTAPLLRRLEAAACLARKGYRTAFHFDPIFYYPGWQEDYSVVVAEIFRIVPQESIAWISLGSLRMTARQKKMIENRFPDNTILAAELVTAKDGKVRYHDFVREKIYQFMVSSIKSRAKRVPVYLCMEPADMWRRLGLRLEWD